MKMLRLLLAIAAIHLTFAQAQDAPPLSPEPATKKSPDPAATLEYIHGAWDTLTRSMTDCHSLVDIKVTANPVLYMPAETPAPPEVAVLSEKCHVRVISLPQHIQKLGDVRPDQLSAAGLLYLPNPYVVPGGRFNEMYGWDSYFILLGLAPKRERGCNAHTPLLKRITPHGRGLNTQLVPLVSPVTSTMEPARCPRWQMTAPTTRM